MINLDEIFALRDQRNRTVRQALDECGEPLQTGTFVVVSPGRIRVAGPPHSQLLFMPRAFLQSARRAAAAAMIMIVPPIPLPSCVVCPADEGATRIRLVGEAPSPCPGVTTLDQVAVSDKKRERDIYQMRKEAGLSLLDDPQVLQAIYKSQLAKAGKTMLYLREGLIVRPGRCVSTCTGQPHRA